MKKQFMKVPEGRFERIMFSAALAEGISGNKVSKDEIMKTFEKENLELTSEQLTEIDKNFK